jgi:hypothetical protein
VPPANRATSTGRLVAKPIGFAHPVQPADSQVPVRRVPALISVSRVPALVRVSPRHTLIPVRRVPALVRVCAVPTLVRVCAVPTLVRVCAVPTKVPISPMPARIPISPMRPLVRVSPLATVLLIEVTDSSVSMLTVCLVCPIRPADTVSICGFRAIRWHVFAVGPGNGLLLRQRRIEPGHKVTPCRVLVAFSALRVIPVRHVPTAAYRSLPSTIAARGQVPGG